MRTVVKHSYIKPGPKALNKAREHIRYICFRTGGKTAKARKFFNQEQREISYKEIEERLSQQSNHEVLMHKLVLSPGAKINDIKEYAREVMQSIASRKGLDLHWYGVVHDNTKHQHVHIVVLGSDKAKHRVRFNKDDHLAMRQTGDEHISRHRAPFGDKPRDVNPDKNRESLLDFLPSRNEKDKGWLNDNLTKTRDNLERVLDALAKQAKSRETIDGEYSAKFGTMHSPVATGPRGAVMTGLRPVSLNKFLELTGLGLSKWREKRRKELQDKSTVLKVNREFTKCPKEMRATVDTKQTIEKMRKNAKSNGQSAAQKSIKALLREIKLAKQRERDRDPNRDPTKWEEQMHSAFYRES